MAVILRARLRSVFWLAAIAAALLVIPSGDARLATSGPRPESAVGTLVLVNSDGFWPVTTAHKQILLNLPPDVKAIVHVPDRLAEVAREYTETFADDFRSGRFALVRSESQGNWARDFMPEAIIEGDGSVSLRQFGYFARPAAEGAARDLARALGLRIVKSDIYLEFGNLIFDGRGTAFATEFILRFNESASRGGLGAAEIERRISRHLGLERIVWLPRQPMELTGHIDMFAKLIGERTMLVADSHLPERQRMLADVAARFTGLGYRVIRLMHAEVPGAPEEVYSYTNSTIVNRTAFVPVYFDPESPAPRPEFAALDAQALETYRSLGFRVVPVPAAGLVQFGGSVHCLTRQLPRLPGR